MEQNLTEICGFKIQAHRRAELNQQMMQCRYECNGHKIDCKDYVEVKVPRDHYLITKS